MSPERWTRIQALFVEVKDLEPEERVRRLGEISRSDPELHSELESILDAHDRADELLGSFERLVSQPSFEPSAADEQDLSTPDPHGLIGRAVSHYEVTELLGAGGMGVLYKAEDIELGRTVALKFLPPQWSLDAAFKKRFRQEARAVAALDHPNVCAIYEVGETDEGQLFIAMAYYEGETVREKITRGPIEVDEALELATQAASGLAAAHAAGLTHRDIKPANLMVTEEGVLKILDFGLAKTAEATVTEAGMRLGTPAYMSPEQTRGEEVDSRTDLWSLGVVLYEMLTARRPFHADSNSAVIHAIRHEEPERPGELREGVPEEVAGLVLRLLSKDPETRYAGAELLSEELATSAPAPTGARGRLRGLRRSPWLALGSSAAAVALAVALGVIVLGDRGPAEGAADANALERPLIVVLPFENRGPAEQEYFAAGVTDEITSRLAASASLGVISRTSAIRYARSDKTAKQIGEDLGVDYILEGSVLWAEGDDGSGRVRVMTQLIRAADDTHIWAQPYDREIADIFQIQSEIAGQVVERVGTAVGDAVGTGTVGRPLAGPPTEDLEAYSLYMRGRFLLMESIREGVPVGDLERAVGYLQQAIEHDPDFALAYASLAWADFLSVAGGHTTLDEILPRAKAYIARARELSPAAPEVLLLVGDLAQNEQDWRTAEETYSRIIEFNQNFSDAHFELGNVLLGAFGNLEGAIREVRLATLLDPLTPALNQQLGRWLYYAGDYEGTLDAYERMLEVDPEFPMIASPHLAAAYVRLGRYEEAIRAVERDMARHPRQRRNALADLASILAEAGQRAKAIETLEEAKALGGSSILVAVAYGTLEEPDSAFAYLSPDDIYVRGQWVISRYVFLKLDPRLENLRSDPRWASFIEELRVRWKAEW